MGVDFFFVAPEACAKIEGGLVRFLAGEKVFGSFHCGIYGIYIYMYNSGNTVKR